MRLVKEIIKKLLGNGVMVTIRRGVLAGKKYRLNRYSGVSPLFADWEKESRRVFAAFVRPGDVVYDLGANVGIHSLNFSLLAGAQGTVYAFEPAPFNIAELEVIKRVNGAQNMTIVPLAVSNQTGKLTFALGDHPKGGSLEMGLDRTATTTVDVTTIDLLIREGMKIPDFLKVDIEGAEGAALEGMDDCVAQAHPTMYVELHNVEQDLRVGAFLAKHGYEVYRVKTSQAINIDQQTEFLKRVKRLDLGHPNREGMFGCVVAVHPTREALWRDAVQSLCAST